MGVQIARTLPQWCYNIRVRWTIEFVEKGAVKLAGDDKFLQADADLNGVESDARQPAAHKAILPG